MLPSSFTVPVPAVVPQATTQVKLGRRETRSYVGAPREKVLAACDNCPHNRVSIFWRVGEYLQWHGVKRINWLPMALYHSDADGRNPAGQICITRFLIHLDVSSSLGCSSKFFTTLLFRLSRKSCASYSADVWLAGTGRSTARI